MTAPRMHPHELHISVDLVSHLVAEQFPQWANLPLESVTSGGTDNAMYRLGNDLVVRLPRIEKAAMKIEKECYWLPKLAPFLPLETPKPIAQGKPAGTYPWQWAIYQWIEGDVATTIESLANPAAVAIALAQFVAALQQIDPSNGPKSGKHNGYRGKPLANRSTETRKALKECQRLIDTAAATKAWEESLSAPTWDKPFVWLHGDLHTANLLTYQGRLKAVIDFADVGLGDPACDLIIAWTFLDKETRKVFREALSVDDATWLRGRGWALSIALIMLPYYLNTNPEIVAMARRVIGEVLEEL